MNPLGLWLVRAGTALAALAFFLPQVTVAGGSRSPFVLCSELAGLLPLSEYLYHLAWLLSMLLLPLLLFRSAWSRDSRGAALPWGHLVLLLLSSFALSTLGSILLTAVQGGAGADAPPAALSLILFVLPLAAAATALGRILGGGEPRATGRVVRASLGLLLALHGAFLLDAWGRLSASWTGSAAGAILPAAWLPLLGGLLVLLGDSALLLRPAPPAPDPAAGGGKP